ncbi:MAG: bifunctional nuclease family protein [Bacteroidia bacterium]|nr:bifunctional nuclease family protein [Bacteroidia bacterium]
MAAHPYPAGEKREVLVIALAPSETQPGNYTLILEEPESRRRIPLIIGGFEAQAIAVTMEQMQPLRPLTHDLFRQTLDALGVKVAEVVIHSMQEGVFYADLYLRQADGTLLQVDARPSDAIALAVRAQAPVYTFDSLIEAVAIWVESLQTRTKKGSLEAYSLAELEELLARVIAKEDFESALRIRDIIDRRRGMQGQV